MDISSLFTTDPWSYFNNYAITGEELKELFSVFSDLHYFGQLMLVMLAMVTIPLLALSAAWGNGGERSEAKKRIVNILKIVYVGLALVALFNIIWSAITAMG